MEEKMLRKILKLYDDYGWNDNEVLNSVLNELFCIIRPYIGKGMLPDFLLNKPDLFRYIPMAYAESPHFVKELFNYFEEEGEIEGIETIIGLLSDRMRKNGFVIVEAKQMDIDEKYYSAANLHSPETVFACIADTPEEYLFVPDWMKEGSFVRDCIQENINVVKCMDEADKKDETVILAFLDSLNRYYMVNQDKYEAIHLAQYMIAYCDLNKLKGNYHPRLHEILIEAKMKGGLNYAEK